MHGEEAASAPRTVPRRFMEAFWKRSPVGAGSELRLRARLAQSEETASCCSRARLRTPQATRGARYDPAELGFCDARER